MGIAPRCEIFATVDISVGNIHASEVADVLINYAELAVVCAS